MPFFYFEYFNLALHYNEFITNLLVFTNELDNISLKLVYYNKAKLWRYKKIRVNKVFCETVTVNTIINVLQIEFANTKIANKNVGFFQNQYFISLPIKLFCFLKDVTKWFNSQSLTEIFTKRLVDQQSKYYKFRAENDIPNFVIYSLFIWKSIWIKVAMLLVQ